MSYRRPKPTNPDTCPGIREFIRPTMKYMKCHLCGTRDIKIALIGYLLLVILQLTAY